MRNCQAELKRQLDGIQSTLEALQAYERKLYWNAQNPNTTEADNAETQEWIRQAAESLAQQVAALQGSVAGEKAHHSALSEKIRVVDLGVAVFVDQMVRHYEALQADGLNAAQIADHQGKIKQNAKAYKQALDELIGVLDDDTAPIFAKNGVVLTRCSSADNVAAPAPNPTACSTPAGLQAFPHLAPLNVIEEKTLDGKLNLFHSLLSTFATLPEVIQFLEINGSDRVSVGDVAEVYKVYGGYLSDQFSHLHRFAQDHFDVKKGGNDE